MTIKSNGAFLCDHFLIDTNGKSTLVGIFKNFNTPKLPTQIGRFYIVSFMHAEGLQNGNPIMSVVSFKIIGPDGKELKYKLPALPLKFSSENKDALLSLELNGFAFNEEGTYKFKIFEEEKMIVELELLVTLKK